MVDVAVFQDLEGRVRSIEEKLEGATPGTGDSGLLPARQGAAGGSDAQILKKVSTRLQDFEAQITAQLSNMQSDFDKKLSHVNRGASSMKPLDSAGASAGLDTMAEDLDQLKYDVGELKDLLSNNKGEVNHIRRIVLACERDMEDFTAAMDAVNVDLDEMRARVDATHSIITSRQRVEATMTAEISTMRLDIGDIQEALKNHDSWMEDVSNTLQQMQEKEENLTEDIINLKNEMNTKLDTKVDNVAWKEANDDLDAAIKTVRDMVSSLRLDVDARRRKVDEILATIRHDITAVETNLEESKAKITSDTDQAVNALNGRIDFTNKDLAATQESLHTTQNSLSDCFNEVAVVRSDLERNVADTEARLKNDIRQKQQEAFEKIGAVEQQAELRSAEASRRLGALDLRMSGVQGGLGEHKRDILKLREEVNGLTVKSASHEVDIQKTSDAVRKMEKQRNMDEQNWKAQMDAVHDVLDTKVNEKPFEDLKHCVASLTKGVVKFAQVVGVFPGPRFDDSEGVDQSEADVELLGWEECAENMSFRVDKAWRQRCSQRFRNILDMIAKKADHSVLRLLQISQQHIESQLERVKHERELWKEVVERRQQQPLQLALSMKEQTGGSNTLPAAPQSARALRG
jgi:chromosome segregation ATPase